MERNWGNQLFNFTPQILWLYYGYIMLYTAWAPLLCPWRSRIHRCKGTWRSLEISKITSKSDNSYNQKLVDPNQAENLTVLSQETPAMPERPGAKHCWWWWSSVGPEPTFFGDRNIRNFGASWMLDGSMSCSLNSWDMPKQTPDTYRTSRICPSNMARK